MRNIIPLKSGHLAYQKYDSTGALDKTIIPTGLTVQTLEPPNFNVTTQDVPDGNSMYPLAIFETGAESQVSITYSDFSYKVLADMVGGTFTEKGTDTLLTIDEGYTIPSSSPYTVPVDHTIGTDPAPVILGLLDGSAWVKVDNAPSAKQYSVSGSVFTFNSADAGAEVFATYSWQGSSTVKIEMPEEVDIPTVRLLITDEQVPSNKTGKEYDITYYVDKARITGDVRQMTQQSSPGTWTLTWRVLKPRAGQKPWYAVAQQRS